MPLCLSRVQRGPNPFGPDELVCGLHGITEKDRKIVEKAQRKLEAVMAYTIFMSHGSRDVRWVKWIADQANQVGIQAYLYEHDAQLGRSIAEKVKLRIQQSDAVVVLLTTYSLSSTYVQQEIGFAEASGKLIIPLIQPGMDQRCLAMLHGREYVLFDFDNPGRAVSILVPYLLKLKQAKEGRQALLAFATLIFVALGVSGRK